MATKLLAHDISESILDAFYEVYDELGFGFLEYVHVAAMVKELKLRQHNVIREELAPVYFKGHLLCTQRIDIVVDNAVIVEVKSSALMPPNALRQLHNYLHATDYEVGLLLHFGTEPKFYRRILTNDRKYRSSLAPSALSTSPADQQLAHPGESRNGDAAAGKDPSPQPIQAPVP